VHGENIWQIQVQHGKFTSIILYILCLSIGNNNTNKYIVKYKKLIKHQDMNKVGLYYNLTKKFLSAFNNRKFFNYVLKIDIRH